MDEIGYNQPPDEKDETCTNWDCNDGKVLVKIWNSDIDMYEFEFENCKFCNP